MGSAPGIPGEGDLHRLVDGVLDAQRQGEVLLHLRDNAAEAAQVAAWREQNDLLKATFAGVEHEAVPASLRLTPLRLRCIGDTEGTADVVLAMPATSPARSGSVRLVTVLGLCLAAAGLTGSWLVVSRPELKSPSALFAGGQEPDDLVTGSTVRDLPDQLRSSTSELPLASIPDLGSVGLSFTDATMRPGSPDVIVFLLPRRSIGAVDDQRVASHTQKGGTARLADLGWRRTAIRARRQRPRARPPFGCRLPYSSDRTGRSSGRLG